MNFDDSETYQHPSEDILRQRDQNWKVAVVILVMGFAVCMVGAVVASQKDHDVAVMGENVYRGGMIIVLVGMVGFLIGRRLEHIWKWVDDMINRMETSSTNEEVIPSIVSNQMATGAPPSRSRFQFSLAKFLSVTTGIGITIGLLFSLPGVLLVAFVLLTHLMITIVLTVSLVYGRSYIKTFCIGALIPAGVILLLLANLRGFGPSVYGAMGQSDPDLFYYRLTVVAEWIGTIMLGMFAIFVRVMIEPHANRNRH